VTVGPVYSFMAGVLALLRFVLNTVVISVPSSEVVAASYT
jgi:hypothetical protein